jgi:hypothetical protein
MPQQNGWTPVAEPKGWTLIEAAKPEQTPAARSLSGFAGNVLSSGGNFVKDAAGGLVSLGKLAGRGMAAASGDTGQAVSLANDAKGMAQNAPRIMSAAGSGLKNRYGGLEQIKNTLYTDPVGVAADLSMLLDPAAGVAKAGGLTKTASALSRAGELANPMHAIGSVVEPVTSGAARTLVRGTLRPPAAVRNDFGGSKAVADAVLKDRVYSEASAVRKLDASVSQADKMLADAQAAGVPGVPRGAVAKSVLGTPKDTAQMRVRLGKADQTPNLTDEAKAIFKNNPSEIPLTDAQAMKREAQTLAYEAGTDNQSVQKAAEIEKAKALRAGIENRVPAVGPVNEQSQRLLGSKLAFGAAEDRPRALTNFLSILGGGAGFAGGGPVGAIAIPALMKAADSPRLGAMAGIGVNEIGRAMSTSELMKAALIARLQQQFAGQE